MTTPNQKITPEKVTKPIQLLAAWLVGLIMIDGAFLLAASSMEGTTVERMILVIASVVNVPIFLFALFLLQTKFRPELQEDSFYSQYLDKKTNVLIKIPKEEKKEKELEIVIDRIRHIEASIQKSGHTSDKTPTQLRIGLNHGFPDFEKLREILREESIPLAEIFGNEDEPAGRNVAIPSWISYKDKKLILNLACKMNMESYLFFDPREELIDEDVLFGAYGDSEYPVNDDLRRVLSSDAEEVDLKMFERTNRIKS